MNDSLSYQVGGSHYKDFPVQPLEYAHRNELTANEHGVVKYVMRWRTKGGVEDLRKAHHYCMLHQDMVRTVESPTMRSRRAMIQRYLLAKDLGFDLAAMLLGVSRWATPDLFNPMDVVPNAMTPTEFQLANDFERRGMMPEAEIIRTVSYWRVNELHPVDRTTKAEQHRLVYTPKRAAGLIALLIKEATKNGP